MAKTGNNYQVANELVIAYCIDCVPADAKLYCTNARKTERCETCGELLAVNYVSPVDDGTFDVLSSPIKSSLEEIEYHVLDDPKNQAIVTDLNIDLNEAGVNVNDSLLKDLEKIETQEEFNKVIDSYRAKFLTKQREMKMKQLSTRDDYIAGHHFEKRSEMRLPKKTSLGKSSVVRVPRPTHVFYFNGIEIGYQTGLNIEACVLDYLYPYHDEVNDHEYYKACALRDFLALVEAL